MTPVKRFLVFVFDHYYASGGWADLAGMVETEDEAFKIVDAYKGYGSYQIIDTENTERLILHPEHQIKFGDLED